MKPNTVIVAWPEGWNKPGNKNSWKVFIQTIRNVTSAKMALLIPKGIKAFPDSNTKVEFQIYTSRLRVLDMKVQLMIKAI